MQPAAGKDQFKDASRDLLLALTRSGLQNSSARARRFGDLQKQYDTNARTVPTKTLDFENKARSSVESAKSDLYSTKPKPCRPGDGCAERHEQGHNTYTNA